MAQDDERRSSSKEEAPRFVWEAAEPAGQGEGTGSSNAPTPSESRDTFPPRRALVAGAAAVVLAAGAFGIVDYTDRSPTTAATGNTTPSAAGASALTSSFPNPTPSATDFASRSPSPSASPSALPPTTAAPSSQSPAPSASTAAAVTITTAAAAATTSAATDLALGKSESSSSHTGNYVASNVIDGNPSTYWESQVDSGAFSEWVQVDLGTARTVSKVVMRLPPSWSSRTQTIEIYGLATGYNGFVIKSPTSYTFSRSADNAVTVTFAALSTRYVQLIVTANSAVSAGQMGEVEVYG